MMVDPVGEILERHGITDPWSTLESTGVANRIYAPRDVVLRVATDHPEAVSDARTESVAAPVVSAAESQRRDCSPSTSLDKVRELQADPVVGVNGQRLIRADTPTNIFFFIASWPTTVNRRHAVSNYRLLLLAYKCL
jgi:hypothetical protein